jgi:hypothetical protein
MTLSSSLEVPTIAFFGRTFGEYIRMFGLDPSRLAGRKIADVAAGPSSFAAEGGYQGIEAVAVDPLYGLPAESLAVYITSDYASMTAAMRRLAHRDENAFRYGFFPSIDAAENSRRAAAEIFLSDYETGFVQGRYAGGSLPRLSFADGIFDLVLCGHLLFTYGAHFDFEWHLEACRELMRISTDEVRIHPICGLDGRPYPALDRLMSDLNRDGIASEVISVDYEFFAGTNRTLLLKRHKNRDR